MQRLFDGRPVLEARPENDWEARVVLNPAADVVRLDAESSPLLSRWRIPANHHRNLVEDGAAVVMLYRAQGAPADGSDVAPSSIGFAVFDRTLQLVKRWNHPVLLPDSDYNNLGIEDPRITRVGDVWHMYYAGYSGSPKRGAQGDRQIKICHATSDNLVDWTHAGPIAGALQTKPNKNAVLLPKPVDGEWVLLHRPMEGPDAMAIHYATSSNPGGPWSDKGLLMSGLDRPECSRSWIGAGGPPVPLGGNRFLVIYHRGAFDHSNRRSYDLGAALIDFGAVDIVQARIEPIVVPTGELEQIGDSEVGVDNVVFTCANFVDAERLVIPYAGADTRIFAASIVLQDLVDALEARR